MHRRRVVINDQQRSCCSLFRIKQRTKFIRRAGFFFSPHVHGFIFSFRTGRVVPVVRDPTSHRDPRNSARKTEIVRDNFNGTLIRNTKRASTVKRWSSRFAARSTASRFVSADSAAQRFCLGCPQMYFKMRCSKDVLIEFRKKCIVSVGIQQKRGRAVKMATRKQNGGLWI